ncbi:MAG TPA: hypothetical protein GX505_11835 [Clostridiales bacterium]|nr:hypothetical protein [Clostridiales bacterium]
MVILDNGIAAIGFSKTDGSIVYLGDLKRGIRYVERPGTVPFRIEMENGLDSCCSRFSYSRNESFKDGQAYELTWVIEDGIVLNGLIQLDDGSDQIVFKSRLENSSEKSVLAVEYPVIGNMDSISEDDCLAHPYVTGFLVKNPLKSFDEDGGLRFMPYPESFSGASMQFFTYYARGKGGLYAAAYDPDYYQKWLNFYKSGGKLELSHIYGYEDIGAGKGLKADYPFVVKFINGDDWYEAADIYKEWAVRQEWTQKGTLYSRSENEKAVWLLEDTGLSTFGINAKHDRTKWLKAFHDTIGTSIFHILGPDWVNDVQTFGMGVPGGYDDWVPTKFNKENLVLIKEQGDRFAPFEFDFLVDPNKSDSENLKKNLIKWPKDPKSHDGYKFNMLCPCTDYTKDLHIKRDVQVLKEAQVDSMYYDISANNLIKTCMDNSHGHPVGAGREMTLAYREIYKRTKEALSETAGKYIPLGTEMMNEVFIDVLDYYQARAWAQPCSALETWPFSSLMKTGMAQMIPMFTYVYHEYAPVRLDGWGKLVEEIGELYYHTVAKIYLWGGLYELNYEYSPMEAIDGVETRPEEHYWNFEPKGYKFNEERAKYISQFAGLRTGHGNKYLAYGIMKRPVNIRSPKANLDWHHYNHNTNLERGSIEVDAILTSTWLFNGDENASLAVMLANTVNKKEEVTFELDLKSYGLSGRYKLRLFSNFDSKGNAVEESMGEADAAEKQIISIDLEPKKVYMLEVYR